MKKLERRFSKLLLVLVSAMMLLVSAVPAFAEIEPEAEMLLPEMTAYYLEQLYATPDEMLELAKEEGGFYEVFVTSWTEDRDTVGAFKSIDKESAVITENKEQLICTEKVEFEKYTATVLMYYDAEEVHDYVRRASQGLEVQAPMPKNYEMNINYSFNEKISQAAQNMVVGLATVFAILLFLILVIWLFNFIPKDGFKKKAAPAPAKAAAPAPAAAPAAAAPAAANNDDEIAAVIAAAVAAAMADAPSESGYVVRSVRKVGTRRWTRV